MKKVLLDENLPVKLKYRLRDVCEIYTVTDKKWNSLENSDLIAAMQREEFVYLITSDKNLQYQQNIHKYKIGFILLNVPNNTYEVILSLVEKIKVVLLNDEVVKLIVIK